MYPILYYNTAVGKAEVKKEGLYCCFSCICTPPDREIYRIFVSVGETEIDLGICVPEGENFVLRCRIPAKRLKGDNPVFTLKGNREKRYAVADGEPFAQLDKLENSHFERTDAQAEIITAPAPDPQDSDQNREYPHKWE